MGRRKSFKTEEEKENKNVQLLPEDKETIINFNQGGKKASIFTYERDWQKYFERELGIKPIFLDGFGGREYLVNKSIIKVHGVPKKKNIIQKVKKKVRKKVTRKKSKTRTTSRNDKKKGGKHGKLAR